MLPNIKSPLTPQTCHKYTRHLTELDHELATLNDTEWTKYYEYMNAIQPKRNGQRRLQLHKKQMDLYGYWKRNALPLRTLTRFQGWRKQWSCNAPVISTLDMISEYWRVQYNAEHQDEMAVTSHHGGSTISSIGRLRVKYPPVTFWRVLDVICTTVKWRFSLIRIFDIIIF